MATPSQRDGSPVRSSRDDAAIVRVVELSKTFREGDRDHVVLQDVDLRLPEGAFVAILGRSGSGKSTLLNLIAGIDAPSAGRVEVAGRDITAMDERERTLFRRANIGFVYQFFNLIPTLSVLENVRLPLELAGRKGEEASGPARELLAEVGLADRADTYPDRLSGGEQQRVAIARALSAAPRIVLADEPTGNLDAEIGGQVLELLVSLSRDRGRSLIVATHSRALARAADLVLVIEGAGVRTAAPETIPALAS